MMVTLSPLKQRALAIGLAVLLAAVVFMLVVAPVWSASAMRAEQVAILKRQAQTMQSLAEAAPKFEALSKRLAADPGAQSLIFTAPQAALAVAQLQEQLTQVFQNAGATVMTSQPLPDTAEGALVKIKIQTTLDVEMKSVVAALHAIGAARPLLKVEKLAIRDPDGEWANTAQTSAPNRLQVEMIISAYMRRP